MKKVLRDFLRAIWTIVKLPVTLVKVAIARLSRAHFYKLVLFSLASFFVTVVYLSTLLEATSQPKFCGSCHLMEPYIASWKASKHHDVSCMTCHARAGLSGFVETKFTALSMLVSYATGVYVRSKPWAEIEDRNCLSCHETRLLQGKIEFGGVVFDHTPHLAESRRGRKLRCTSCHGQIVQGNHLSVTTSTCFLCHFKNVVAEGRADLASCTKCHTNPPSGAKADSLKTYDHAHIVQNQINCNNCHRQMWEGSGEVRRDRCGVCHSQVAHIEKIDDLEFIHEWHLEKRKLDCQLCHDPIEHRNTQTTEIVTSECRTCHDVQHAPMLAVYYGKESRLLGRDMPAPMQKAGVVCMSCHKDPVSGEAMAGYSQAACVPCHDQSYFKLVEQWRTAYGLRIARLEQTMKRGLVHPQIEDARHDLAMLKKGGAWHNTGFADSVLARIETVLASAGVPRVIAATLPKESQACLACHAGIAETKVTRDFSPFDHAAHLGSRGISCNMCHTVAEAGAMNHGRLKPTGTSCTACHHDEATMAGTSCEPCHQASRSVYLGTLPGMDPKPSPMSDAGLSCKDCHTAPGFQKPQDASCLECHDKELVDALNFTRGEFANLMSGKLPNGDAARIVALDKGRAVHNPDLAKGVLVAR